MTLSPANACIALLIMGLGFDRMQTWRWVQPTIAVASVAGVALSLVDHAWLYGAAYLIAGGVACWRGMRR